MGWDSKPASSISASDLRCIVDALRGAVVVADGRGHIRFVNSAAGRLLGAPPEHLTGAMLPFSPDDQLGQLEHQSEPLELHWTRTLWDGNTAWMVEFNLFEENRPSGELPADPRLAQAEQRIEQLLAQLQRLQESLDGSDDARHDQQILLQQKQQDLLNALAQLDEAIERARQSDSRAQATEERARAHWEQSEQTRRNLEQRVQQLNTQVSALEENDRKLREEASQIGPPTHWERQAQQAQRRMAEQLQRIQNLEAQLEAIGHAPDPQREAAWDEMRAQLTEARLQAEEAEQRASELEQMLLEQQQKVRDTLEESEALAQRLSQTEQSFEETRQGLEQQLEHLSNEDRHTKRLAFEDQLTNLPNQNILQQFLDYTAGLVSRQEGAAILMLLDIDRLRSLNNTLNYAAGDELLTQFAARLKGLCRNTDVLGRRGDDEFLVVVAHKSADPRELSLARTTVAQMAQSLASKILNACQEPFTLAGTPVQVTCSIGIAAFNDEAVETTLEQCQVALDRARELGRARFQFYGPDLHDRIRRRVAVVPRLREALERQEFVLQYQPIVDLRNGKMVGAEALLRWNEPNQGMLNPGDFLPAAEASGLIVEIGEWAVQEACLMAAQHRELFISVNLSPRQLMHGDFSRRFMKAIERARVKPDRIVVEISEATSSADPERVSQVLAELARWNVGLAIDDFGTGSSNLLRLQREKPRFLKIDTAFVNQLPDDKTSFHIVLAACHLAASLQMQSLAEGVEKDTQLRNLVRMGCQLAQGRYLSPPVPPAQLKEMLKKTWKLN